MAERDERVIRQEMRDRVRSLVRFMENQQPSTYDLQQYKKGYLQALDDAIEVL
jgi:hypothetical protein